ncbi:hypothetical protein GQ44DRAFT_696960 [Phaeosphaeriaceae sp. PMI808]|nr:hypothetical protein GQ44DRAFT_696960 [Phaeosphaeriaceae sp. PMI808]
MRFLQIQGNGELSLAERAPDCLPPYAILSHTWGASNEEVTYQDFLSDMGREKVGHRKLALCGKQAARDGFEFFWVDTCCVRNVAQMTMLTKAKVSLPPENDGH